MRLAFQGNFTQSHCSEVHHARSLESLGHQVVRLQEGKVPPERLWKAVSECRALIWVHTHSWHNHGIEAVLDRCKKRGIPIISYHLDLYYGIPSRFAEYKADPYFRLLDHFYLTDGPLVDWFNENTSVKAHYLPAGVLADECYMAQPAKREDVIFVGSYGYHPEHPYRPKLLNWLQETYGERFSLYGGNWPGQVAHVVRGAALNQVYANAKVVVGDSFCPGFTYPNYWSDRVPETLGRGGFLIHPRISGIERDYTDGEHLVLYEYNDWEGLREKIDYYLDAAHVEEREKIRRAGHELVKGNYTYRHRWEHILKEVFG